MPNQLFYPKRIYPYRTGPDSSIICLPAPGNMVAENVFTGAATAATTIDVGDIVTSLKVGMVLSNYQNGADLGKAASIQSIDVAAKTVVISYDVGLSPGRPYFIYDNIPIPCLLSWNGILLFDGSENIDVEDAGGRQHQFPLLPTPGPPLGIMQGPFLPFQVQRILKNTTVDPSIIFYCMYN
tara:strand:+ start:305 stop:850 length:546 start_codon:yes stop_codon:yes gene_type:complete